MLAYLVYLSPRDLVALVDAAEAETEQARQPALTPAHSPPAHPPPTHLPPAHLSVAAHGSAETPAKPPPPLGPSVLALPTVSLALAFTGNPLALAVNVPLMLWNAVPIVRRAWGVWRRERRLNVDFLDTLAIGASIVQGHHVTGGIITWLIRLGDWIRDLTAAGSKRAIAELMDFQSPLGLAAARRRGGRGARHAARGGRSGGGLSR